MTEMCFTIGNQWIERRIYLENGVPMKSVIQNMRTGMRWESDGKEPLISFAGIELKGSQVTLEESAIVLNGADWSIRWEFRVFDDLSIIESRIGVKGSARETDAALRCRDFADGVGCDSNHLSLTAVTFYDCTDYTDCLLEERTIPLYHSGMSDCKGHVFILRERLSGEECLLVKNAPCEVAHRSRKDTDFYARGNGNIHICSNGLDTAQLKPEEYRYTYSVAVGVCGREESRQLFRQYYEREAIPKRTYIMSNTWGDRNCDKCVCEEFILKEIEKAAQLGCDIVQIDDGWQMGITANSALVKGGCWSGGYRQSNPDFWEVHRDKFPGGFARIVQSARDKEVSLGLWFSPDNYHDYEAWELDAQVMLDFYHKYGIRYFKIDGVMVENTLCEENLLRMFRRVTEQSRGEIVFNMDITAGKRFGYLLHREIGEIFVENRYTDWTNYYPHNTLRNLWELSRYLPSRRFQMEMLNNQRNKERYRDILAPAGYEVDYLFAAVMVSNPLLWMELSELDKVSSERLAGIIFIYRKYREDFREVIPVMDRPDGFSRTGFFICGAQQDYVLLFRELTEENEFPYQLDEVLATNDPEIQKAPVKLSRARSYVFGTVQKTTV